MKSITLTIDHPQRGKLSLDFDVSTEFARQNYEFNKKFYIMIGCKILGEIKNE